MFHCSKCWETPCSCGHEYKGWTREKKLKLARSLLGDNNLEILAAARRLLAGERLCEVDWLVSDLRDIEAAIRASAEDTIWMLPPETSSETVCDRIGHMIARLAAAPVEKDRTDGAIRNCTRCGGITLNASEICTYCAPVEKEDGNA